MFRSIHWILIALSVDKTREVLLVAAEMVRDASEVDEITIVIQPAL